MEKKYSTLKEENHHLRLSNSQLTISLNKKRAELRMLKRHFKKIAQKIDYLLDHPYTSNFSYLNTSNTKSNSYSKNNRKKIK